MTHRWIATSLLVGCADPYGGVSVGNPNLDTLLRVGPPGDGITLTTAEVSIHSIVLSSGSGDEVVDAPAGTDVLGGVPLGLPAGEWRDIRLELSGAFVLEGTDGAGVVDLELAVPAVSVQAQRLPFELEEPHVFELGFPGWLTAEQVGWAPGSDHVVRAGDYEHDVLVDLVTERSALYLDADGDGMPDR